MYDVIVVGGGPAGLQAALTLGRMHQSALLIDSGQYRNEAAHRMHNFATNDGTPPADFRAAARKEIAAYETVEIQDTAALAIDRVDGNFTVTLDGGDRVSAARIVLATGVRDVLPDIPGLEALWGTVVAHCPFCHGHELSGRTVAVQGGPSAARAALMLSGIADRVVVIADGFELDDSSGKALRAAGVEIRAGRIGSLVPSGEGARVVLDDGSHEDVDGFFVASAFTQSAPFADDLGLTMLPSGCIEVDEFGRTSLPKVYAAGDLAHLAGLPMPLASVLSAAAAGLVAAAACVHDPVADTLGASA